MKINEDTRRQMLEEYEIVTTEEQKSGIFRNRFQYGQDELLKIVSYRKRGLIDKKYYTEIRNIIEIEFLFY